MKKRVLSVFLVLCMVLALLPVTASAVSVSYPVTGGNIYFYYDPSIGYIEDCDESVTEVVIPREINGIPVTRIGYGAFRGCSSLKSVSIPDSVTYIDMRAFDGCSSLTSITIPDSVTSIRECVFEGCSNLTTIAIPSSVTSIEHNTFYGCSSLTNIIIPNSVTTIESQAFYGCSSLTSVTIPDSVTSIEHGAFMNCDSLTSVVIPDSVTDIGSQVFLRCSSLISVTIPDSVTSIGNGAFWDCSSLTSVTIPDSVTTIEYNTFFDCSELTSVTIPDSVTSIGVRSFYGCESLTDVYYRGTKSQWEVIDIGTENEPLLNATIHCSDGIINDVEDSDIIASGECGAQGDNLLWTLSSSGLLKIEGIGDMKDYTSSSSDSPLLPPWNDYCEQIYTVIIEGGATSLGDRAFSGCFNLTDVIIPDSVANIGYYTFQHCFMTDINIPYSVTSIEHGAFMDCHRLTNINVASGNTAYVSVDGVLFSADLTLLHTYPAGKLNTSYNIPDSVTQLESHVFDGCDNLTNMTILNGIITIPFASFQNCRGLTSVTIPSSVSDIDMAAFFGCNNLTDVYYNGTKDKWNAIDVETENAPLYSATIHCTDGDIINGDIIASGICGMDNEGNLSDNLTWTLYSSGLLEIKGTGEMKNWYAEINEDDDSSPWENDQRITNVVLEDGVKSIGSFAFSDCRNLSSVKIPDSITTIGSYAFADCRSLTSVDIPNSITSIGYGVFNLCSSLTSIAIPNSVTSIEDYTFADCSNLTTVTIPFTVTEIYESAFRNCNNLTDVYYGGTIDQWYALDIDWADNGNDPLDYAIIHCTDGYIEDLIVHTKIYESVKYVPYSYNLEDPSDEYYELSRYVLEQGSLPTGLSLNEKTGEIYGIPMTSGTFEFAIGFEVTPREPQTGGNGGVPYVWRYYTLTVLDNTSSNVQRPNDYPILDNVGTQDPRDPNGFLMTEYCDEEFIIDGPYEEFHRLLIDGKEKIKDVDYTVREGSTVITIQAQTFRDVGEGTHTIAAEFRSTDESGKETIKQVAQNYTMTINRPSDNTSNDSSSSGSSNADSSSPSYSITVPRIPNCTVTVTPTSASANAQVTLTVRPNTGYKLSGLTVTGPKGEQIPLAQTDEFQYTFRMPSGNVNISAQVEREQPVQTPAGDTPFVDMLETDWFYQSVRTAYERGWMAGTSANTFAPYTVTSRGMFVAVLHRIAGEPFAENSSYFSDVPLNQYYATAAAWAAENGIVSGYGDGRFGSSDDLTREQIVMILYNYANLTGMDTTARSGLTQFNDLDKLSSGAQTAMSWASSVGLISGKGDGILDPAGSATRAEMAALLVRFAGLTEM